MWWTKHSRFFTSTCRRKQGQVLNNTEAMYHVQYMYQLNYWRGYGNNPVLYGLLCWILNINIFYIVHVRRVSDKLKMCIYRIEFLLHSWHECYNTVSSCVSTLEDTDTYIPSCKYIKYTIYQPTSWAALKYKMLEKEDSMVLRDEYPSSAVAGFSRRLVSRWPIFLLNETVSTCRL